MNDPLSLNLYSYCYNNPITYIDPTGHWGGTPDDPRDDSALNPDQQAAIAKLTAEYYQPGADKTAVHNQADQIRNGTLDPSSILGNSVSTGEVASYINSFENKITQTAQDNLSISTISTVANSGVSNEVKKIQL